MVLEEERVELRTKGCIYNSVVHRYDPALLCVTLLYTRFWPKLQLLLFLLLLFAVASAAGAGGGVAVTAMRFPPSTSAMAA